jgi:Ohr subfamily peroxiredoxin
MNIIEKVIYRAEAHTTGGRDGASSTPDGQLSVKLAVPKEMGGNGAGTNPEQLFAAGYSACFMGALKVVSGKAKVALPADASITGLVGIGAIPQGYGIEVELRISLPGLDKELAHKLVETAHQVCPYSNATRGNIQVTLTVL